jgi:hypothetical protein
MTHNFQWLHNDNENIGTKEKLEICTSITLKYSVHKNIKRVSSEKQKKKQNSHIMTANIQPVVLTTRQSKYGTIKKWDEWINIFLKKIKIPNEHIRMKEVINHLGNVNLKLCESHFLLFKLLITPPINNNW